MHMVSMPAMVATPGRKLLVGVLSAAALLLALVPSVATPAGKIVVYGAHSGSTLTLSTKGSKIVVKGKARRKGRASPISGASISSA